MEKFVTYFVSVNLLLLLQAVYYRLFLAKQQRFVWNRSYLLGGLAIALLLPLIRWEIVPPSLPNPSFIPTLPEIVIGAAQPEKITGPVFVPAATTNWVPTLLELGLAVYGTGVVIALAVLAWRNIVIIQLIWKGKKTRQEGYTLVATTQDIGPASYFRYIFWNEGSGLDAQCAAVAMAHERCHSRQLHSLDLIGVELFKAFCWINPAIYMLRKDLRETHEFLADQAALKVAGLDGIKRLMLQNQLGTHHFAIANYFYSHIKARVMRLNESSKRKTIVQYVLVLPLAGLMAACTSLAHPMEGTSSLSTSAEAATPATATSDSQRTQPSSPAFFQIEDVFVRAQLPEGTPNPEAKGMVCMGRQPEVLNLDTVLSFKELDNVDNHPYLLNRDRIVKLMGYPEEAKTKKITGKVVVKLLVDETGHVVRHQFVEENHPLLRDAVEAHVRELLFKPGLENGKPTEWWVIMPFSFGMPGC